ncbi:dual specificity protein phosphatase 22-A-like [Pyrgilauda ruficollis]|uniref:dual specificity protein phosphatase 22-A-like n=1 Tax=Pyrgilauda ruficollis TaxID=221976 RepID=UPI001B8755F7|nr:dual specificity protein phosphatase 22-A-like [Pyrgilauda ruficollis]
MGTGMSKIVTGLYLGNIHDSEDHENLLSKGVTHILSVHNRAKPVLEDMTYLCISASDSSSQNLAEPSTPGQGEEQTPFSMGQEELLESSQRESSSLGNGNDCGRSSLARPPSLAGVSRSSTVLVAYLMTVTELGWQSCLAATRAVRSYASPNPGFQQQLQEYESTLLHEYRAWIRREYGRNPFQDQEELQRLLEQQQGSRDCSWPRSPAPSLSPPCHTAGTAAGSRCTSR